MQGISKKDKRLMDADDSVVIAGGRMGIKGLSGNAKNTIEILKKIY